MSAVFYEEPLPYSRLEHKTRWRHVPISEEYVIPAEDKQRIFEQLYPFVEVPSLDESFFDELRQQPFVVRDFKVVREDGMNMLASPYYYLSGATVIDWVPLQHAISSAADTDASDEDDLDGPAPPIYTPTLKKEATARYFGLLEHEH